MQKSTFLKFLCALFVVVLTFTACQQDELIGDLAHVSTAKNERKLTEDDAKIILQESLKSTSQELSENLLDMILQVIRDIDLDALCDTTYSHDFEFDREGLLVQNEYAAQLSYMLECRYGFPQKARLSVYTDAGFSTDILSSTYTSNLNGMADKLNPFDIFNPYRVDGEYTSNRVVHYHLDDDNPVITDVVLVADIIGLTLNKWTRTIDNGEGNFLFTAENDVNGEIVMEGGFTVTEPNVITFTLNGEEFFVLDLNP